MTTKTFTLTAEIEYDPTSTSPENMAIPMHNLLEDAMDVDLLESHGELFLHSCEVSDDPPEKKPPQLFEDDNWTEHGNALANSVDKALKDIIDECREDGVDLRHAAFIVQQEVSTAFLQAHLTRFLEESKKRKAAKKA